MEEVVEEAIGLLGEVLLADAPLDDVLVEETVARGLEATRRELHEDARLEDPNADAFPFHKIGRIALGGQDPIGNKLQLGAIDSQMKLDVVTQGPKACLRDLLQGHALHVKVPLEPDAQLLGDLVPGTIL